MNYKKRNQLENEHQKISFLIIEKNITDLIKFYGSEKQAKERLKNLEYQLNYNKV